jgi:hypothetical protein
MEGESGFPVPTFTTVCNTTPVQDHAFARTIIGYRGKGDAVGWHCPWRGGGLLMDNVVSRIRNKERHSHQPQGLAGSSCHVP